MDKKYYIVFFDGSIGYIDNICTCDKCKERGNAEVCINDLDGEYLTCLAANDDDFKNIIYFGESLSDAINSLIKSKDRSKEILYLQGLIDFYSKTLVEIKNSIKRMFWF